MVERNEQGAVLLLALLAQEQIGVIIRDADLAVVTTNFTTPGLSPSPLGGGDLHLRRMTVRATDGRPQWLLQPEDLDHPSPMGMRDDGRALRRRALPPSPARGSGRSRHRRPPRR